MKSPYKSRGAGGGSPLTNIKATHSRDARGQQPPELPFKLNKEGGLGVEPPVRVNIEVEQIRYVRSG